MRKFYRVSNENTQQGLWYNFTGEFTGLIHNKFSFCKNNDLKMEFDSTLIGYLSATPNLEDLYHWFTKEDILTLQKFGYFIHEFESEDFKFYGKFQHYVINQNKSRVINKIVLT